MGKRMRNKEKDYEQFEDFSYDSSLSFEEKSFIKRTIKKIIRKNVRFLLKPFIDFQNEINRKLKIDLEENNQKFKIDLEEKQYLLQECEKSIERLKEIDEEYQRHLDKMKADLGAVSRQLMAIKWKEIDAHRNFNEKPDDIVTCDICGYSAKRQEYETKETDCIFNGGHLVRYVCPRCDVIFGPSKFTALGQDGIDEDYWVHYLGFQEGDSTEKEIRAFKMLDPDKNGIYLNYGCGNWSKSIDILRKEGYQVYGYEPYAANIDNPYIISGVDNIKSMKFDGIFSNDLLEHLINPIEDLKFMKSLLLRPKSKMAHSTGCFAYKHEITRFHTHFFVGKSADILAEKTGFKIVDRCDDLERNDFICCVFQMNETKVSYLKRMYVMGNGRIQEDKVLLETEASCFGPYIDLGAGSYQLNIELEGAEIVSTLSCTAKMGKIILYTCPLLEGHNIIHLNLEQLERQVEFVIKNNGRNEIVVKAVDMY